MSQKIMFNRVTINGYTILLTTSTPQSIITHEKWRCENDFYLFPKKKRNEKFSILDIGGGCGIWAIYIALQYPNAAITVIISNPEEYITALENKKINIIKNLEILNKAPLPTATTLWFAPPFGVSNMQGNALRNHGFISFVDNILPLPSRFFDEKFDIIRVLTPGMTLPLLRALPQNFSTFILGEVLRNESSLLEIRRELTRVSCHGGFSISGFSGSIPKLLLPDKKYEFDLSVILPIFNVAQYLKKCIDSIIEQPFIRMEILLVNDGSTDESTQIADYYCSNFSHVKHIKKENGGCASARQCGLNLAKGEYISFVDPDDWLSGNGLMRAVELACLDSPDIVQFGYIQVFDGSNTTEVIDGHNVSLKEERLIEKNEIRQIMLGAPSIWRRIYKQSFIRQNELNFEIQFRRHDDLPFSFETLAMANTMRVLPEAHYFYRLDRPGQDVGAKDDRLFIHFDLLHHIFDFIKKKNIQSYHIVAFLVYIGTHRWVLEKIERKFLDKYEKMIRDDFSVKKIYTENKEKILPFLDKNQENFLKRYF